MMRREVLRSKDTVKFVDEDQEMQTLPDGETQRGDEANFVKIVFSNVIEKFKDDLLTLKEAKQMMKASKYLRQEAPELIKEAS